MANGDSIEALALNAPMARQRVTQKASAEDWVRRALIALACLWLLVGVVLPLFEVVNRATNVELVTKIEEPTEQEKRDDSFRGQIDVAGRSVVLVAEEGRPVLYIDNKEVPLRTGKGEAPGIAVETIDEHIEKVVCERAHPGVSNRNVLDIAPIVVEKGPGQRWMVDSEFLPLGENLVVLKRYIGLANFLDYFGIQGISQAKALLVIGYILAAAVFAGFLLFSLFKREKRAERDNLVVFALLLILAAQAYVAIEYLAGNTVDSGLAQSVWNSLNVAIWSTFFSVGLAFVYAYGIHRTLIAGKAFFRLTAMIPLFAPTMLYGLSLVYLFGNKGVVTTGFFDKFSWLAWDIGLYGFTGIVIAEVVFTFPPAFMILLVALANTDARLYEAAESLGAGKARTFFTVTLPSVKFGLLSAIFVCFTLSFTDFGAPKVVGGQYNILAVDIYKQVIGQQNFGMGATVSIILLVPTVLAFVADRIVQRRSGAVITARSVPYSPKANKLRDAVFFAICSSIAFFILTMVFMAGVASFVKIWPYAFTNPEMYPQLWTISHYSFADVGGGGYAAFWNSVIVSALTAVFGAAATFASAYLIEKTKGVSWLRQGAYFLSIIPLALPGLVIGIAYIFFFNNPRIEIPFIGLGLPNPFHFLYGTMAILVVCNVIHFYTVSFLTATTALRQLDKEFEAVSESMAVPFYKTFFRVTVPVCLPAILEIAAFYFVSAMATVSAVIFLYTSDMPLASVAVVNMDDAGDTAPAAAMCMLIVATNVLVRGLMEFASLQLKKRTQAWRKASA